MAWVADPMADVPRLLARADEGDSEPPGRPPVFKIVGIALALASGVFIGTSFVIKKVGLLKANTKYNEEAGEGYGYLKNLWWWGGMVLMIVGEICNFAAYAFVDAIMVTTLGALSVVITTILSAIFLKERLSFVGKVGCFNCIIGSVVIVLNAPAESAVADIQQMKDFVITPGFLSYTGVIVLVSAFIAFWVGPRYGKKSMLVYLSICSLVGGLSVVCTQGLGAAIVAQAGGKPQFNQWFIYVLLVFVIITLLVEIIYLNKALNLFNAALVTPTYYVFFTTATIVTSAILFQGFRGTPISITTVVLGFLQICAGVILLQMSKSAKDVPDAAVFKGDLDQVREIGEQEQPESEPKADAIRGAAAILRRFSVSRQKKEEEEARQFHEEKMRDSLEPVAENEIVQWDGLRRRKTVVGDGAPSPLLRQKTLHPPLGMSRFPDVDEADERESRGARSNTGFLEAIRARASSALHSPISPRDVTDADRSVQSRSVALGDMKGNPHQLDGPDSMETVPEHAFDLPPIGIRQTNSQLSRSKPLPAQPTLQSPAGAPNIPLPSPLGKGGRRQFSFQNMFRGPKSPGPETEQPSSSSSSNFRPLSRSGISSRMSSAEQKLAMRSATEEERLGLVHGDSNTTLFDPDTPSSPSDRDSNPSTTPPRAQSPSRKYTYTAPAEESIASSPEASTPLMPRQSYLLSTSTISGHAPLFKDFQSPEHLPIHHLTNQRVTSTSTSTHLPPHHEEAEAGIDYNQRQIPVTTASRNDLNRPAPHVSRSYGERRTIEPTPPLLPPYQTNDPHQTTPTRTLSPIQHREPAPFTTAAVAATAASAAPDRSPATWTSRHQSRPVGTVSQDSDGHGSHNQSTLPTTSRSSVPMVTIAPPAQSRRDHSRDANRSRDNIATDQNRRR